MSDNHLAPMQAWVDEPLPRSVVASCDRLRAADGVRRVALMPDAHLARDVCVGAAIAIEGIVYPQAVGGDIGCGMAAVAFDLPAEAIDNERAAGALLAGLYRGVPSLKQGKARTLPAALNLTDLSDPRLAKMARREGAVQLGTLGRGNHFLELQADTEGRLWALVHSGSRAMGQAIASHHLAGGETRRGGLTGLLLDGDAGQAYLADAAWASDYAKENRLAMLRVVETLCDELFDGTADWDSLIHSDHNHARLETHEGRTLCVHRKGAQSAAAGEPGVVPGSMGAPSFHTVGRGCVEALTSCSHGAGRRMSRTEARAKVTPKAFGQQVGRLWYDHRRVGALRDEAPAAYKDVRRVMRAQRELTKVVQELRPVLSYKGT